MINATLGERGAQKLAQLVNKLNLADGFHFARVAVDAASYEMAFPLLNQLKDFDCYINLMRIASLPRHEVSNAAKILDARSDLKGIYFADSFGSMDPVVACDIFLG